MATFPTLFSEKGPKIWYCKPGTFRGPTSNAKIKLREKVFLSFSSMEHNLASRIQDGANRNQVNEPRKKDGAKISRFTVYMLKKLENK